jgi:DNA invertase Pin-like site-specific DNA recombinase
MIYGYARVSTDGQCATAQTLREAGPNRFSASGARADRVQLRRALAELDAGDALLVTRLDRLAR